MKKYASRVPAVPRRWPCALAQLSKWVSGTIPDHSTVTGTTTEQKRGPKMLFWLPIDVNFNKIAALSFHTSFRILKNLQYYQNTYCG